MYDRILVKHANPIWFHENLSSEQFSLYRKIESEHPPISIFDKLFSIIDDIL